MGVGRGRRWYRFVVIVVVVFGIAACSSDSPPSSGGTTSSSTSASSATDAGGRIKLPQGNEPVSLDPANFVSTIDNPYWPMKPGTRWVFENSEDDERIEVTVTNDVKVIQGVRAVVVRDVVTVNDRTIEDTFDWFAQDIDGNVWYLGEDTTGFGGGSPTREGSWEAGVDGAYAGVVMPAHPQSGVRCRQEYYEGHAEDQMEIVATDASARVPYGSFDSVVQTKDTTPLEPDVLEHKFYARGIGPVLTVNVSGGGREELVEFTVGG